jgi:tRNA U55 pseudouridine synthase TruB
VEYAFEVRCSGGTYIRSLARDLGEKLACGACLSSLTRAGVQPFRIEEAHSLEELRANMLLPWWEACRELPKASLPSEMIDSLLLGRQEVLKNLGDYLEAPEHLQRPFLVYVDAASSKPLGLLAKNEKNDWGIAVNFGFPS